MEAATVSAEVQRILGSEAYADYLATEVQGMSRQERADAAGKNPSTVSAAVKRIQGYIDDGKIPDPRTSGPGGGPAVQGVTLADKRDIAEGMMPGASMFVEQTAKLDAEFELQERRIRDAQSALDSVTVRRDQYRDLAEKAGFNWDEYDALVAAAETPTPPATDEAADAAKA